MRAHRGGCCMELGSPATTASNAVASIASGRSSTTCGHAISWARRRRTEPPVGIVTMQRAIGTRESARARQRGSPPSRVPQQSVRILSLESRSLADSLHRPSCRARADRPIQAATCPGSLRGWNHGASPAPLRPLRRTRRPRRDYSTTPESLVSKNVLPGPPVQLLG